MYRQCTASRRRVLQGLGAALLPLPAAMAFAQDYGFAYLDAAEFGQAMQRDHEYFKQLVQKPGIKV